MTLVSEPGTLDCAVRGDGIDSGCPPVVGTDDGDEPLADATVRDACGFTAVGVSGCAPELDDVTDSSAADAFLRVRLAGEGSRYSVGADYARPSRR